MLRDKEPASYSLIQAITFQRGLSEYQQRYLNEIVSAAAVGGCEKLKVFTFQAQRPERPVIMVCFHGIDPNSENSHFLEASIIATNANNPSQTFYDSQIHKLSDPSMRECIAQIKKLYRQPELDCNLIWDTDFRSQT